MSNKTMTAVELAEFIAQNCIPSHILDRKDQNKPYVIGVSGSAPGLGKSTLVELTSKILEEKRCTHLDLDNWIVVSRQNRELKRTSGIDPVNWDLDRLVGSLERLIVFGEEILIPIYDHKTGTPNASTQTVSSANIIILAGASCLWKDVRPFINFLFCIHAKSEEENRMMVIKRNINFRNYLLEKAMEDYIITKAAYEKHVAPHSVYADVSLIVDSNYNYIIA